METEQRNLEKGSIFMSGWLWIKGLISKLLSEVVEIARQTKNIARDDPRKLFHSIKVGLALSLVSLFYYVRPLYSSFGVSAMWAVMTVVVVFEFSVGATLAKGMNRALGTILAGALGLGAHHLASATGKTCEPILIELFVFLQAVILTFIRFFPRVKAKYDYGILIFILTFCLVSESGFRNDEILKLAQERLSTILIGASICVIVSIIVSPVWAGEDLHKLVAHNIGMLGNFLEDTAGECFRTLEVTESGDRRSSQVGLNSILDSKSREEILANFARWEPGHGQYMFRHPWKQYLKLGNLTRQCASRVEALNNYLTSKAQAPQEIRGILQERIFSMTSESGKALKELAWAVQTMTIPPSPNPFVMNLKTASKNLKSLLKSDKWGEYTDILQVVPMAAVASLQFDIALCVENIADAVNELSILAKFTSCKDTVNAAHKKINEVDMYDINPHISIVIDGAVLVGIEHEGQSSVEAENNHNL